MMSKLGQLSALFLAFACRGEQASGNAFAVPGEQGRGGRGGGGRITVEVLNASGRSGLARVGVRVLRRAGIDVVTFGNAAQLDSTEILVRRGTERVGERVRRALGAGRVLVQLDSTLLLDASVLLGADFTPRLDFHP
jgi:hypothetical protein